jgi:CheY-like chemotaxis protein
MLTKNKKSRQALKEYLTTQNKAELLTCYLDLEEIRGLTDEQALTRASALVWRYKTQFEAARNAEQNVNRAKSLEVVLWECLGRLRYVDGGSIEQDQLIRMINNAQNDLLAKLIIPFEGFLNSKFYKTWQESQMLDEKGRQVGKNSGAVSIVGSMSISSRSESFSVNYSNVLIVDDSLVTLKLTRLTLEKDGHIVDKAMNGQIALDMLKQRLYDVVLIDLNMPVMDGFETIRLFREYERNQAATYTPKRHHRLLGTGAREAAEACKEEDGNVSDLSDDEALTSEELTRASQNPSPNDRRRSSFGAHGSNDRLPRPAQVIIGMSTNVDDLTRKRALEAGMDFFLPKPFTLQKFTEIIKISIQKNSTRCPSAQVHAPSGCDVSVTEFNSNSAYSP